MGVPHDERKCLFWNTFGMGCCPHHQRGLIFAIDNTLGIKTFFLLKVFLLHIKTNPNDVLTLVYSQSIIKYSCQVGTPYEDMKLLHIHFPIWESAHGPWGSLWQQGIKAHVTDRVYWCLVTRVTLLVHFLLKHPTIGVVTPSPSSENGFSENGDWGKRGTNRIASPWRKVWNPFVAFSENREWKLENEVRSGEKRWIILREWPILHSKGEEVRVSILWEWTLRRSRTDCHVTILRPWRMGLKGCDNPKCICESW